MWAAKEIREESHSDLRTTFLLNLNEVIQNSIFCYKANDFLISVRDSFILIAAIEIKLKSNLTFSKDVNLKQHFFLSFSLV